MVAPDAADVALSFTWLFDHIHIAFWVGFLGLAWKVSREFTKFISAQHDVLTTAATTKALVTEVHGVVATIKDNHLAHLAQDIKEVSDHNERHIELLTSIDKNIAVIADRSARN